MAGLSIKADEEVTPGYFEARRWLQPLLFLRRRT
jgi:hypothetical protein